MDDPKNIFDKVITESGTEYVGIIDYSNKKNVIFYDLSNHNDPDIVLIVISWRLTYSNMRFSVFVDIFYPNTKIDAVLIPKKHITNMSNVKHPKHQQTRKRVTRRQLETSSSYSKEEQSS